LKPGFSRTARTCFRLRSLFFSRARPLVRTFIGEHGTRKSQHLGLPDLSRLPAATALSGQARPEICSRVRPARHHFVEAMSPLCARETKGRGGRTSIVRGINAEGGESSEFPPAALLNLQTQGRDLDPVARRWRRSDDAFATGSSPSITLNQPRSRPHQSQVTNTPRGSARAHPSQSCRSVGPREPAVNNSCRANAAILALGFRGEPASSASRGPSSMRTSYALDAIIEPPPEAQENIEPRKTVRWRPPSHSRSNASGSRKDVWHQRSAPPQHRPAKPFCLSESRRGDGETLHRGDTSKS